MKHVPFRESKTNSSGDCSEHVAFCIESKHTRMRAKHTVVHIIFVLLFKDFTLHVCAPVHVPCVVRREKVAREPKHGVNQ